MVFNMFEARGEKDSIFFWSGAKSHGKLGGVSLLVSSCDFNDQGDGSLSCDSPLSKQKLLECCDLSNFGRPNEKAI